MPALVCFLFDYIVYARVYESNFPMGRRKRDSEQQLRMFVRQKEVTNEEN
jgi:hypothetical protein